MRAVWGSTQSRAPRGSTGGGSPTSVRKSEAWVVRNLAPNWAHQPSSNPRARCANFGAKFRTTPAPGFGPPRAPGNPRKIGLRRKVPELPPPNASQIPPRSGILRGALLEGPWVAQQRPRPDIPALADDVVSAPAAEVHGEPRSCPRAPEPSRESAEERQAMVARYPARTPTEGAGAASRASMADRERRMQG